LAGQFFLSQRKGGKFGLIACSAARPEKKRGEDVPARAEGIVETLKDIPLQIQSPEEGAKGKEDRKEGIVGGKTVRRTRGRGKKEENSTIGRGLTGHQKTLVSEKIEDKGALLGRESEDYL